MELLTLMIVIVMLGSAVAVLLLKEFLAALAAFSVVSLGLSVLFVILRAPDVAMTEAAIGAGLSEGCGGRGGTSDVCCIIILRSPLLPIDPSATDAVRILIVNHGR